MKLHDILRDISLVLEDVKRSDGAVFRLMIDSRGHFEVKEREMRSAAAQNPILLDVHARDPLADRGAGARSVLEGL